MGKKDTPIPNVLSELKDAPYNPRFMTPIQESALGFSMEEFGDLSGFVFNIRTGVLVSGHKRKLQLPADSPVIDFKEMRDDVGTVGHAFIEANGKKWPIRFVDWDEEKEKAGNITANNTQISGGFTDEVNSLLEEIEAKRPDLYDQTLMHKLGDESGFQRHMRREKGEGENSKEAGEFDLSPYAYESYNYVILFFRTDLDWYTAIDHFGLKVVQDPDAPTKIGIGCVVDGRVYLDRIVPESWKSKLSSPVENEQK